MIELRVPLPEAAGFTASSHTTCWVFPSAGRRPARGIVFGFPGGSYSKEYYHFMLEGFPRYSMAEHFTSHGYVFVACDHLGVGDSAKPPAESLTLELMALANRHTVAAICAGLSDPGSRLGRSLNLVPDYLVVGAGHSLGAQLMIIQQAAHATFHAMAILGSSAIRSTFAVPPDLVPGDPRTLRGLTPSPSGTGYVIRPRNAMQNYKFFLDDVPPEVIEADAARMQEIPPCVFNERGGMFAQSVVAEEARAVEVPLFLAFGERDIAADPHAEPSAYPNSPDITLFTLADSAHCHNLASSRHRLWDRLVAWVSSVPLAKDR